MEGNRVITTIEATDAYRAMREFRTTMRNTWALSDPKTLRIVPVKEKVGE